MCVRFRVDWNMVAGWKRLQVPNATLAVDYGETPFSIGENYQRPKEKHLLILQLCCQFNNRLGKLWWVHSGFLDAAIIFCYRLKRCHPELPPVCSAQSQTYRELPTMRKRRVVRFLNWYLLLLQRFQCTSWCPRITFKNLFSWKRWGSEHFTSKTPGDFQVSTAS